MKDCCEQIFPSCPLKCDDLKRFSSVESLTTHLKEDCEKMFQICNKCSFMKIRAESDVHECNPAQPPQTGAPMQQTTAPDPEKDA